MTPWLKFMVTKKAIKAIKTKHITVCSLTYILLKLVSFCNLSIIQQAVKHWQQEKQNKQSSCEGNTYREKKSNGLYNEAEIYFLTIFYISKLRTLMQKSVNNSIIPHWTKAFPLCWNLQTFLWSCQFSWNKWGDKCMGGDKVK